MRHHRRSAVGAQFGSSLSSLKYLSNFLVPYKPRNVKRTMKGTHEDFFDIEVEEHPRWETLKSAGFWLWFWTLEVWLDPTLSIVEERFQLDIYSSCIGSGVFNLFIPRPPPGLGPIVSRQPVFYRSEVPPDVFSSWNRKWTPGVCLNNLEFPIGLDLMAKRNSTYY